MARDEPSGGRGQGAAAGKAVGTGGKATGEEGVTEEGGGGFRLTPLNAPEIQYISYFASIKRKIELVWQYPYDAAVAGIEGELTVDFVIGRNGKLESVALVRGSGHKVLDDEAIRSIRMAAPFDPIPAEYKIPSLQIRGRFLYIHGGAFTMGDTLALLFGELSTQPERVLVVALFEINTGEPAVTRGIHCAYAL